MMGDEATKWFLRHHFRNHGLTVLRYFLKRGFMETLVKAYNICVTMVAQGHRHQLSIPQQDHGLIPSVTSVHMYNQYLEKAEIHQTSVLHLV